MCGIAGILGNSQQEKDLFFLQKMMRSLDHRGPDGRGHYIDENSGALLGHTRLSILDLSDSGKQPMISADGRYVLTFNGEIYNYLELKKKYFSHLHFHSSTDTEVLLQGLVHFGPSFVSQLNGMFAFCFYDRLEKKAYLVRDRLGVKPLYYTLMGGKRLIFSSELKSLLQYPQIKREIDVEAFALFLRMGAVPAPWSIIKNVKKLPAAHMLTFSFTGQVSLSRYWEVPLSSATAAHSQKILREKTAETLENAIKRRLRSDVKVGSYLSGGVDSTLITALSVKLQGKSFETFSTGYDAGPKFAKFNEDSILAQKTAGNLGIKNHQLFIGRSHEFKQAILKSIYYRDEPDFAANNVAQYMLSHFVSQLGHKVILDGTGGDEIFLGYGRFLKDKKLDLAQKIPSAFWHALSYLRPALLENQSGLYSRLALPRYCAQRMLSWIQFREQDECAELLESRYAPYAGVLNEHVTNLMHGKTFADNREAMSYLELSLNLPEVLNASYDRMSMANSVEVRSPFMDVELVELAMSLAPEQKIYGGRSKALLKDSFPSAILPDQIKNKVKSGWTSPVNHWVKNLFRADIEKELHELKNFPLFNPRAFEKHFTIRRGEDLSKLWSLYVFKKWWDLYIEEAQEELTQTSTFKDEAHTYLQ